MLQGAHRLCGAALPRLPGLRHGRAACVGALQAEPGRASPAAAGAWLPRSQLGWQPRHPCSGPRRAGVRVCSKLWSRERLPGDTGTEQPDDFGNDSDVEEDYSAPLNKEYDSAKASAAASLKFRPHSRQELHDKLKDKGYDREVIKRALNRLEQLVCR